MCSRNQDEVEVVKNELLKAGITAELRREPIAEAMGVTAIELFVPDPRNFFNASKVYARIKERAGLPTTQPQSEIPEPPAATAKPQAEQQSSPARNGNGADSKQANEPRREEWKQASSLVEKGIAQMFRLESESRAECASLRSKVEELTQALAKEQAARAREIEGRVVMEKTHAEQISALTTTLEREKKSWLQQLKGRDDSLKSSKEKLESMSGLLETSETAAGVLKEQVVALELQVEEHKAAVRSARTEALAEREARVAAEERAQKLNQAQASLEKERVKHKELEKEMQAHVASLTSLFHRSQKG